MIQDKKNKFVAILSRHYRVLYEDIKYQAFVVEDGFYEKYWVTVYEKADFNFDLYKILKQARLKQVPEYVEILPDKDHIFCVQTYVDAESLGDSIENLGPLLKGHGHRFFLSALKSLRALHKLSFEPVLINFKPENIVYPSSSQDLHFLFFDLSISFQAGAHQGHALIGSNDGKKKGVKEKLNFHNLALLMVFLLTGQRSHKDPIETIRDMKVSLGLKGLLIKMIQGPQKPSSRVKSFIGFYRGFDKSRKVFKRMVPMGLILLCVLSFVASDHGLKTFGDFKHMSETGLNDLHTLGQMENLSDHPKAPEKSLPKVTPWTNSDWWHKEGEEMRALQRSQRDLKVLKDKEASDQLLLAEATVAEDIQEIKDSEPVDIIDQSPVLDEPVATGDTSHMPTDSEATIEDTPVSKEETPVSEEAHNDVDVPEATLEPIKVQAIIISSNFENENYPALKETLVIESFEAPWQPIPAFTTLNQVIDGVRVSYYKDESYLYLRYVYESPLAGTSVAGFRITDASGVFGKFRAVTKLGTNDHVLRLDKRHFKATLKDSYFGFGYDLLEWEKAIVVIPTEALKAILDDFE